FMWSSPPRNVDHFFKRQPCDQKLTLTSAESQVAAVRKYIRNQEEHRRRYRFQDEFRRMLARYQVAYDELCLGLSARAPTLSGLLIAKIQDPRVALRATLGLAIAIPLG